MTILMDYICTTLFIHHYPSDFFFQIRNCNECICPNEFLREKKINPLINRNSTEDFGDLGVLSITYIASFFEGMYNQIRDQNQAIRNFSSEDKTITGFKK